MSISNPLLPLEAASEVGNLETALQLLIEFSRTMQRLSDPEEIMTAAARLLGEHLQVHRCAYTEVGENEDSFQITSDYARDTSSILGNYSMSAIGENAMNLLRAGQPYIVEDAASDARAKHALESYRRIQTAALVCVPLQKNGVVVAAMTLHQKTPRPWTAAEISLTRLFLKGCFEALQRARAAHSFQQSQERSNFISESLPQKIFTANAQGDVEYFNSQWMEFTGLTYEQIKDWGWTQFIHPDDVLENVRLWKHSLETGEPFEFEHRFRRVDGQYRWHLSRARAMLDTDGGVLLWSGSNTDIDEIKRAEERQAFLVEASRVIASSLDYQTTLAGVAQMVVPHLADWCTVDVIEDDGSMKRLAVAHCDPKKTAWAEQLQKRYPEQTHSQNGIWKVMATGESQLYSHVSDELLVASAKDAGHLKVMREIGFHSAMIVPLSAHGRILGVISFVAAESKRRYQTDDLILAEDIAKRAALAIDNAKLYRDAQKANRLKDEFLATVSHELRTPMTAILGWSQMLMLNQFDSETATQALETIERNARWQMRLIDDLLDTSRIITGKLRLDVKEVNLVSVLEAAADAVRPAAIAKEIDLQLSLDSQVGMISGDPDRLQQVVWNLLSNALKFTPQGGRVQMRLQRAHSHLEIIVSDSGQGISAEFLPHAFDRFRQADSTNTRAHGGLGLGLAIVRQLVELHGGSVQVESDGAGKGATFTVILPATVIAHERSTPAVESAPQIAPLNLQH